MFFLHSHLNININGLSLDFNDTELLRTDVFIFQFLLQDFWHNGQKLNAMNDLFHFLLIVPSISKSNILLHDFRIDVSFIHAAK